MGFLLAIIYLSFISLGLPDALLGAAWPNMQDRQMIRMGQAIILGGIIVMLLPFGQTVSLIGFLLILLALMVHMHETLKRKAAKMWAGYDEYGGM